MAANDLGTGDSGHTPLSSEETLVGLSDSSRLFFRLALLLGLIHLKNRVTDCPKAAIGLIGGEVTGGGDSTGAWHVCSNLDQCASSTKPDEVNECMVLVSCPPGLLCATPGVS